MTRGPVSSRGPPPAVPSAAHDQIARLTRINPVLTQKELRGIFNIFIVEFRQIYHGKSRIIRRIFFQKGHIPGMVDPVGMMTAEEIIHPLADLFGSNPHYDTHDLNNIQDIQNPILVDIAGA